MKLDPHSVREKWLHFRLDDSRWWATTILVAVAVWATPMSPIVHHVIAIIAWVAAIIFFAISITWDYWRWHWPFLPLGIQRQIEKAEQIRARAGTIEVRKWREETASIIREAWSYEAAQYRKFGDLPPLPNPLMELDMLLTTLKELDPR